MGWIRFSDDFYDNDKLSEVGPLGIALHVAATGFCNRNLTDGYFKKSKARLLLDFDGIGITTVSGEMFAAGVDGDEAVKLVVEWMVAADLWHEYSHDCGDCHARADGGEPGPREYLIHDYLKYQPSKAEVEKKAADTKARVAEWRAKQAGNDVGNSVTNDVRTQHVTPDVHHTPTPSPTPSSSSLVTKGGGGTKVDARGPRPHCSKHPNENSEDEKCRPCMRRREWDEEQERLDEADELDAKRRQKDAAAAALANCKRCGGTGQVEVEEGFVAKCECREVC